jgi:ATP-dependent DNA helicase PIF1
MAELVLNEGQQAAVDAIRSGMNVFLTGEGGTGKSVAIRKAVACLRYDRRKTVLCAPTGIAAQEIGGTTIHSAFRFDFAPKVADALEAVQPSKVVHEADTIIIDEIGMVRRDLMDAIARVVALENAARAKDPERKHLQLVVVGDFSQLPPVVTDKDKPALVAEYGQESATTGFYAFEAGGWKTMDFSIVQLTEPMRQSDPEFVEMLNRARVGDESCLPYFNRLADRPEMPSEAVCIVARNKDAENINLARLDALDGRSERFTGTVDGEFKRQDMAAPETLELKKGAHVITVANDRDAGFVNGSTGTVEDLHASTNDGTPAILVRLDGSGTVVPVRRKTWENNEYKVKKGTDGKSHLEQITRGTFTQYPLKLAWAITYHKSQGQTLQCISIDPSSFAPGQLYVGLSRATSAAGIWLTRRIKPKDLEADEAVVRFYEDACGWKPPQPATGEETPNLEEPQEMEDSAVISNSRTNNARKVPGSLGAIQRELHRLLGSGKRTWVRVYELIARVEEKELYRPDFKSFTAWIEEEARQEGVAESLLWHRKSAGDFYREWAKGKDAPLLADGEKLSEENLNIVRKIAKLDPERGDELMDEMVREGLSTKELRKEWREQRREATASEKEPNAGKGQPCQAESSTLRLICPDQATFAHALEVLRAAGMEIEEI